MKKVAVVAIIGFLVFSAMGAAALETPQQRIKKGIDNIFYGAVEVPDNLDETNSKGTKAFESCNDSTQAGVARGIARVVGGTWQILTFWYSDAEPQTQTKTR